MSKEHYGTPVDARELPTYDLDRISSRGGLGPRGRIEDIVSVQPRIELDPSAGAPPSAPGHGGQHYRNPVSESRAQTSNAPPVAQPRPFIIKE